MSKLDEVVVGMITGEVNTLSPMYFDEGTLDKYETGGNSEEIDSYIRKLVSTRNAVYGDNYVIREKPLYVKTDIRIEIDSMPSEEGSIVMSEYTRVTRAYGYVRPVAIVLEESNAKGSVLVGFNFEMNDGSIRLHYVITTDDGVPMVSLFGQPA